MVELATTSGIMEAAIYSLTSKKIDEIFALFGIKTSERIDPLITELSGIGEQVACIYSGIPG
jgi:hypothetical protein